MGARKKTLKFCDTPDERHVSRSESAMRGSDETLRVWWSSSASVAARAPPQLGCRHIARSDRDEHAHVEQSGCAPSMHVPAQICHLRRDVQLDGDRRARFALLRLQAGSLLAARWDVYVNILDVDRDDAQRLKDPAGVAGRAGLERALRWPRRTCICRRDMSGWRNRVGGAARGLKKRTSARTVTCSVAISFADGPISLRLKWGSGPEQERSAVKVRHRKTPEAPAGGQAVTTVVQQHDDILLMLLPLPLLQRLTDTEQSGTSAHRCS